MYFTEEQRFIPKAALLFKCMNITNMKIALISCVSKKDPKAENTPVPACELYTSPLFRKAYAYAKTKHPDRIYILSAKHHLLGEKQKVKTYDETLNNMCRADRKQWAETVLAQMKKEGLNLKKDEFIILAGRKYCQDILGPGKIENYTDVYSENNLKGIGYILGFLDKNIN